MWKRIVKILKPGDYFILLLIILLSALSFFLFPNLSEKGEFVTILKNNKPLYNYSLSDSKRKTIKGPQGKNTVVIENGFVWMEEATCPHKVCIRTGKINKCGEMIICIPNKLVILIEGKTDLFDGITM